MNITFFSVSGLLFLVSAAVTIAWCGSMSAMGGMDMPGGWTMSMTWMRMPGQTWPGAAATFFGMWMTMMVAMMLPALMPMLMRYRRALVSQPSAVPAPAPRATSVASAPAAALARSSASMSSAEPASVGLVPGATAAARPAQLDRLTLVAGAGYFFVYAIIGVAAFPLGVMLAEAEMRSPTMSQAVPLAGGVIVVLAGAIQLSKWKAHQLACCREELACSITPAFSTPRKLAPGTRAAWKHGMQLGLRCSLCCASLTAVLFILGVMDFRAMAAVAAAITAERLLPAGERVARLIGIGVVAAGLYLLARALYSQHF